MIPDLKGTVALELANDTIRRGDTVVRGLENMGNLVGDWNGEDEEIYKSQFRSIYTGKFTYTYTTVPTQCQSDQVLATRYGTTRLLVGHWACRLSATASSTSL